MAEPFGDEVQVLERLLRHRYGELALPLAEEESFVTRVWFGCIACYAHGRLKLVLADGDPPWDGLLVPTAPAHHASLRADVPALAVHPVLGKWLHLAGEGDGFEEDAARVVELARADDARVGVEPKPRRKRAAAPGAARRLRSRR